MPLIPDEPNHNNTDTKQDNIMFEKNAFELALSVDVMARTIWGEARGEGTIGMQAVAAVIMNRLKVSQKYGAYWWGDSIVEICQKPYQFSCWNKNDPNYRKILVADITDLYFVTAKRMSQRAIFHNLDDPTDGATHYHARGIIPKWAKGAASTCTINNHIFYRLEE